MRERRTAVYTAGGFALVIAAGLWLRLPLPAGHHLRGVLMLGLVLVFLGMLGLGLARGGRVGPVVLGMATTVIGLGILAWPATGVTRGVAIGAAVGVLGILPRCLRDVARMAPTRSRTPAGEERFGGRRPY